MDCCGANGPGGRLQRQDSRPAVSRQGTFRAQFSLCYCILRYRLHCRQSAACHGRKWWNNVAGIVYFDNASEYAFGGRLRWRVAFGSMD
jgi:hypothetical protein